MNSKNDRAHELSSNLIACHMVELIGASTTNVVYVNDSDKGPESR